MKTQQANNGIINCWQCSHFAVSWDVKRPYSCRLMGFKSRVLPCFEVFAADGKSCQCFQSKGVEPSLPKQETALPSNSEVKIATGTSKMNFLV